MDLVKHYIEIHRNTFFDKVAQNVAEMSLKCRTPKTLMALAIVALCRPVWHSALKGGVVVAPLPSPKTDKKPIFVPLKKTKIKTKRQSQNQNRLKAF